MQPFTETIEGAFYFDPSDRIYQEHFPGYAVVPGSVVIQAFLKAIAQLDLPLARACRITQFRFKRFVTPGKYDYQIRGTKDKAAAPMFKCKLIHNGLTFVTGVLTLCN